MWLNGAPHRPLSSMELSSLHGYPHEFFTDLQQGSADDLDCSHISAIGNGWHLPSITITLLLLLHRGPASPFSRMCTAFPKSWWPPVLQPSNHPVLILPPGSTGTSVITCSPAPPCSPAASAGPRLGQPSASLLYCWRRLPSAAYCLELALNLFPAGFFPAAAVHSAFSRLPCLNWSHFVRC